MLGAVSVFTPSAASLAAAGPHAPHAPASDEEDGLFVTTRATCGSTGMGGANTTITGTIHTSVGNILTDGRDLDNIENGEPLASWLAETTCNIKLAGLLIVSLVINTNTFTMIVLRASSLSAIDIHSKLVLKICGVFSARRVKAKDAYTKLVDLAINGDISISLNTVAVAMVCA